MTITLSAALVTLWPGEASAQRRGHAGGGRVAVVVSPVYYGYGFYDPFWSGYPGWYGYNWYGPFDRGGWSDDVGSARLQVKPRNAEVFVDGYLAGTVDDFDGFLQRLDVAAGEHELTVRLEGYKAITEKVLFRRGATLNIKYELQPLAAGETTAPRPVAPEPAERPQTRPPAPRGDERRPAAEFGRIAVRVQPRDATVIVDGQEWNGSDNSGATVIEARAGSHDIEIRKEGFTAYRGTVRVRAGETVPLNVSLSR